MPCNSDALAMATQAPFGSSASVPFGHAYSPAIVLPSSFFPLLSGSGFLTYNCPVRLIVSVTAADADTDLL
jgi:hypothetical protein